MASLKECKTILKVLEDFMEASGTELNKDKSNLYFFNCTIELQNHLARTLGFQRGSFPLKYLGMLLNPGPTRLIDWKEIIVRIEKEFKTGLSEL